MRGEADWLKQEEKKELRHWALSESVSMREPLEVREGIEEEFFRSDFT